MIKYTHYLKLNNSQFFRCFLFGLFTLLLGSCALNKEKTKSYAIDYEMVGCDGSYGNVNNSVFKEFMADSISFSMIEIFQTVHGSEIYRSCRLYFDDTTSNSIDDLKNVNLTRLIPTYLTFDSIKKGNYMLVSDDIPMRDLRLFMIKRKGEIVFSLFSFYGDDLIHMMGDSHSDFQENISWIKFLHHERDETVYSRNRK